MDRTACLKDIAALSKRMLSAAEAYRWDEVKALEAQERSLIGLLQADEGGAGADTDMQRQFIQATLDNHSAISDIAEPLRDDIKILLDSFPERPGTEK